MATLKSNLNISTSLGHRYSYGLSNDYTEVFEVTQQIDNNDDYINIATFTPNSKAAQSLEGAELIVISNPSEQTLEVRIAYENWEGTTSATIDTNDASPDSSFVCHILRPKEYIMLPNIHAVGYDTVKSAAEGTALSNTAPSSDLYIDSTANMDNATASGTVGSNSSATLYLEPWTSATNNTANLFHVGDLIRVTNEVMKVTAIGDKSNLANNYLTVVRAKNGTTAASDHSDADAVLTPFFNALHDYNDKLLGATTQRVATDGAGNFLTHNFFGEGRSLISDLNGLTKGSICLKFYTKAYVEFSFTTPITGNTDSKLTASQVYGLRTELDDATTTEVVFTVDATNTRFGGRNGVVQKIQDAYNTATKNSSHNFYGYGVSVAIVDGKLRFTSNSNLSISKVDISTASSSGAAGGYVQADGVFPAEANGPVLPELPPDTISDANGISVPNLNVMLIDDGYGALTSSNGSLGRGTIDYDTGKMTIGSGLPHAEFVYSCSEAASLSGNAVSNKCIASIKARSTNAKRYGTVQLIAFN